MSDCAEQQPAASKGNFLPTWAFAAICALLAGLFAWAIIVFGNKQFGGNDQGVLVDEAYRLYKGQHPYTDFPTTQPILFYLGLLWSLQIFGLKWSAFIYFTAAFSVLTFALHMTMLARLGIAKTWSLAIGCVVQVGAVVSLSFWWYNPCTTVAVCLLCTAAVLVLKQSASRLDWCLYCGSLSLASLTKANAAGIMILACSCAVFGCKATRGKGVFYSLVAAAISSAVLAFYRLNPLDVLHWYFAAGGRGIPTLERFNMFTYPVWDSILLHWQGLLFVFSLFPLLNFLVWKSVTPGSPKPEVWSTVALLGCLAAGVLACFTNGELRIVDVPMIITPVALLCLLNPIPLPPGRRERISHPLFMLAFSCLFALATGLWMGAVRYRIWLIGDEMFYQYTAISPVGNTTPFFSALETGPAFKEVLRETTEAVEHARWVLGREPRIFFGPRMGWGYAVFNLQPPLHLPYSWWAGVDYPVDQGPAIRKAFEDASFDFCIFYGPQGLVDMVYMLPLMDHTLHSRFALVYHPELIAVLERKDLL